MKGALPWRWIGIEGEYNGRLRWPGGVTDDSVLGLALVRGASAQRSDQQGPLDAAKQAYANPLPCSGTHHIARRCP
jgi:hypothetical protein